MEKTERYGLIGARLGHSFSRIIHEQLADYTYELIELTEEGLVKFMTDKAFSAVNVTVPYKEKVIPFLDEIDRYARKIGAVNTIVNKNGKLTGYNTDYAGFAHTLDSKKIDVSGEKVLVLGAGGSSKAVQAVLAEKGAKESIVTATTPRGGIITYADAVKNHSDAEILINTTPVGMYPNVDASPADLNDFPACKAFVDIIYNPLKTKLMLQAEEKGISVVGGLIMLVTQAKYAVEHFTGSKIPDGRIEEIYKNLSEQKRNIVLTGMPSSGKTTIGKLLEAKTGKRFVDTDELVVLKEGRSIREIFDTDGEAYFRAAEHDIVREVSSQEGCVIATGGGVIKNKVNMDCLKHNGIIVFIDRPLEDIVTEDAGRPLCKGAFAVTALFNERYETYRQYARIYIKNTGSAEEAAEEIFKQNKGIEI